MLLAYMSIYVDIHKNNPMLNAYMNTYADMHENNVYVYLFISAYIPTYGRTFIHVKCLYVEICM